MEPTVNASAIRSLAEASGLCVSIYVPTPTSGDRRVAPVSLRNQLEKAHRLLVESGMRSTLAENLLDPVRELAASEGVWQTSHLGLAAFLSESTSRHFRTPFEVPELTVVGPRFHIRPLLSALEAETCHVLALDEKKARVLRVDDSSVDEVRVPGMPSSLEEALGPEYSEKQRQMHSVSSASQARAASHGAGDRAAERKNRDLRYCQAVDKALCKHLRRSESPLIVAAAEPLLSIYRHASNYAHLAQDSLEGWPGRTPDADLALGAREILRRVHERKNHEALERCTAREHAGKAKRGVAKLMPEAMSGKVDTLFLDDRALRWGFVGAGGKATLIDHQEPWAEDLLNRAAIETLANGGKVVELSGEPVLRKAVALGSLRY